MIEQVLRESLQRRYDALAQELASSSVDASKRHRFQKELSYLSTVLQKIADVLTKINRFSSDLANLMGAPS